MSYESAEKLILEEGELRLTSVRLQTPTRSFSLDAVGSIRRGTIKQRNQSLLLAALAGLYLILYSPPFLQALGVLAIALVALRIMTRKPVHTVSVTAGGAECTIVRTTDAGKADRVFAQIDTALARLHCHR